MVVGVAIVVAVGRLRVLDAMIEVIDTKVSSISVHK